MDEPSATKKPSVLTIARAVFSSFLGIRRSKDYQSDVAKITPMQAIIGGLIGAAIFIATIATVVHFVVAK